MRIQIYARVSPCRKFVILEKPLAGKMQMVESLCVDVFSDLCGMAICERVQRAGKPVALRVQAYEDEPTPS